MSVSGSRDKNPISEEQRLVDVVRHQKHRRAMDLDQPEQKIVHLDARQCVKRPERLISQQERRLANERSGERHALLLAAGQGIRPGVFSTGQADIGQGLEAP